MPSLSDLHTVNILIHVLSGSIAIIAGVILISLPKGGPKHKAGGRITVAVACVTVISALIGAFFFRAKLDLMAVSVLVGYEIWSGVRALRLKRNGRTLPDLFPAFTLCAAGLALVIVPRVDGLFFWGSALMKGATGAMIVYGGFDMLRTVFPQRWRLWLAPAEHAYKMTSLIGALGSVAVATLMPDQVLPAVASVSTVFSLVAVVMAVRAARRALRKTSGDTPSASRNALLKADSEL